ncbi:hypothetical protein [Candidatus Symbiopectobacterium sp.]|uniref:hypothetical protein n=1 Tax=Candidatus Symbiopectobacterium sp. TaxID=2816440 RepID=UPI0025C3838F|nr:hypothetical protein [Candidatus Symbiopectobacterium sp.]
MPYEDERLPSAEKLMDHATETAGTWMWRAIREINEKFGDGYAKSHPELIVGFMQTAGIDEVAMHLRGIGKSCSALKARWTFLTNDFQKESNNRGRACTRDCVID